MRAGAVGSGHVSRLDPALALGVRCKMAGSPAPPVPHSSPTPCPRQWVTMVLFVLISGPLGWAALLFLCIAAALLLVVNHKLISITRWVGGRVG